MLIRQATTDPADLQALFDMSVALHRESPQYRDRPIVPAVLAGNILTAVAGQGRATFVAVDAGQIIGCLAGFLEQCVFNRDLRARDTMLCVTPGRRGAQVGSLLVDAFEDWARKQGAREMVMEITSGIRMHRTVEMYDRRGYSQFGHTVRKSL